VFAAFGDDQVTLVKRMGKKGGFVQTRTHTHQDRNEVDQGVWSIHEYVDVHIGGHERTRPLKMCQHVARRHRTNASHVHQGCNGFASSADLCRYRIDLRVKIVPCPRRFKYNVANIITWCFKLKVDSHDAPPLYSIHLLDSEPNPMQFHI